MDTSRSALRLLPFVLATASFAVCTLLPLSRSQAWWIRALDFPRLQLVIIILVALAVHVALLDLRRGVSWSLIAVLTACLIYQAWWIVPYTPLFRLEVMLARDVDPDRSVRIISSNVLAPNRDVDGLLALVEEHSPDILVTIESDDWWEERLEVLEPDYPYTIKCARDDYYGMHLYSKLPLRRSSVEYLVEPDRPSIHTSIRLLSGHVVRAYFLHPAPPSPTGNEQSLERDVELLIVARMIAESDEPVIVSGDLNDVAWSRTTRRFRKVSGLLDPRVGRGMFNTFNANYWFIRWPLDHLFHSEDFTLGRIQRLAASGSDHFALFSELVYEGDYAPEQEGLADVATAADVVVLPEEEEVIEEVESVDPAALRRGSEHRCS